MFFFLNGGGGTAYAQSLITAKALTDHECNSTEWHFVINQIDDEVDAPQSITVTWANSESEEVLLDDFTGKTAHYATTSYLSSAVVSATAVIYDDWSGQFNLSHGPCGETGTPTAPPSETVTPSETATLPPTESATALPVPTSVPAGMDGAGRGSTAGLLGLVLVVSGAAAGVAVAKRRRFLHES